MRTFAAIPAFLLLFAGCATHRQRQAFTYTEPIVISFTSLEPTNDYCIASFLITNVSEAPFWFDSLSSGDPIYCVEWKGHFYGLPIPQNGDECTGGGGAKLLPAGHARSFRVVL